MKTGNILGSFPNDKKGQITIQTQNGEDTFETVQEEESLKQFFKETFFIIVLFITKILNCIN